MTLCRFITSDNTIHDHYSFTGGPTACARVFRLLIVPAATDFCTDPEIPHFTQTRFSYQHLRDTVVRAVCRFKEVCGFIRYDLNMHQHIMYIS